jgi:hypothetical protein
VSAVKIPVRTLLPEVEEMLQTDGLYFAGDKKKPGVVLAMISMGGKVYAMKQDKELDPFRFLPTMKLSGPFAPT